MVHRVRRRSAQALPNRSNLEPRTVEPHRRTIEPSNRRTFESAPVSSPREESLIVARRGPRRSAAGAARRAEGRPRGHHRGVRQRSPGVPRRRRVERPRQRDPRRVDRRVLHRLAAAALGSRAARRRWRVRAAGGHRADRKRPRRRCSPTARAPDARQGDGRAVARRRRVSSGPLQKFQAGVADAAGAVLLLPDPRPQALGQAAAGAALVLVGGDAADARVVGRQRRRACRRRRRNSKAAAPPPRRRGRSLARPRTTRCRRSPKARRSR